MILELLQTLVQHPLPHRVTLMALVKQGFAQWAPHPWDPQVSKPINLPLPVVTFPIMAFPLPHVFSRTLNLGIPLYTSLKKRTMDMFYPGLPYCIN